MERQTEKQRCARLIDRKHKLIAERETWEEHWQDVADYVLPRKADIEKTRTKGDKRTELIFDATAIHALELLSASLHGMLTNSASAWFALAYKDNFLDTDDTSKEWLESAQESMYVAFSRSNFQQEIHEFYYDLASFGTACMFVESDPDNVMRFSTRYVKEFCVSENAKGIVDTVYRELKMSARQCIEKFGEDKVSQRVLRMMEKDPYEEVKIMHVVMPRSDRDYTKKDSINKPFASIYCDIEDKKILSESGYDEFPFMVSRWLKASNEVYGRSPAMTALPDIKMLNKMSETSIRAVQKQVDPPLLVPDDGFILPIRTVPSGLNFYRAGSRDRIEPLVTGANTMLGLNYEEQRREAIRQAFYVDQLILTQNQNMTATEVVQRNEEKMRLLAPVLGRLQSELLQPLITRVFNIMLREGQLPEAPPILQGQPIEIEYVSPLARAQRQSELQSILRSLEIAMPLAETTNIMDHYDMDQLMKHAANILGVPSKVLRSSQEVANMRQERQEQQQQAAEMQEAQQMSEVAKNAAPMIKAVE
tara:strand:+ start:4380 stop:5984 length:1605 start_codon:yes stop_codon:yes gene_type:complete